jgi:hypothetical protein
MAPAAAPRCDKPTDRASRPWAPVGALQSWDLGLCHLPPGTLQPAGMDWYLRVVETTEQLWQCRWGTHTYDEHATWAAAEAHILALAAEHQPATIYVHRLDGTVAALGDVPDPAGP